MSEEKKARVIDILLDKYVLKTNEGYVESFKRGNVKKNTILVGDFVTYEKTYDKYMIKNILPRKNQVIRPPVANIDQMIIVLSFANPAPDYLLLDKQLILCKRKNIKPIICLNKVDLCKNEEELRYIKEVYGKYYDLILLSVKEQTGLDTLRKFLKGKVSAFSGNSGVGKSSITKSILGGDIDILIGEIGVKTNKGKHTTKHVKLYEIEENTYLLDTPGFSSYELYDMTYRDLKNYYDEFLELKCDYDDCMHVLETEKVCAVKKSLSDKGIDQDRYDRYVYLYQKLKEQDDRKYK